MEWQLSKQEGKVSGDRPFHYDPDRKTMPQYGEWTVNGAIGIKEDSKESLKSAKILKSTPDASVSSVKSRPSE